MLQQLLIPSLYLFLASCFGVLWFYNRHITAAGIWFVGYLVPAAGFTLEAVLFENPELLILRPITDLCYLLGGAIFSAGMAMRFSGEIPYLKLGGILLLCIGLSNWLWLGLGDYSARAEAISYGSAVLTAMGAVYLYPKMRTIPEKALFYSTVVFAAQFAIVCFVSVHRMGQTLSEQSYGGSIYMDLLNLTMALAAIAVSVLLLVNVSLEAIQKLQHEADSDPLTGLNNRRAFEANARALIKAEGLHFLMICDIDHFKQVNDSWGHDAGDSVIRGFADALRQTCSKEAVIGRIGGEEFAILLPSTSLNTAGQIAENIRQIFEKFRIHASGDGQSFSVSIGLTQLGRNEGYKRGFLRADEALFQAKENGRNQVVTASQDRPKDGKKISKNLDQAFGANANAA